MNRSFFSIDLPSVLAASMRLAIVLVAAGAPLAPGLVSAAPLRAAVGSAHAVLQVTPDPPQVGKNHAVVTLSGPQPDLLARTAASFGTLMPAMSMTGPSGTAKRTGPGRYEFDMTLGMASSWDISVRFSGAVSGTAVYHLAVPEAGKAEPSGSPAPHTNAPVAAPAGAWRAAIVALVAILVVGLLAYRRVRPERRSLTVMVAIGAAASALILAAVQARYAPPPMDMAAMSSVQGAAPIPVTAASVQAVKSGGVVFAPGTIAPYLTQDVVTRQSGILTDFPAYAGDHVRAGQVIARLDAPDVQSRAQAAAADASAQNSAAAAVQIEAQHHAPNAVIITRAETQAVARDIEAARADQQAKAEQQRYWQNELAREKELLAQGAVSAQEYQDETAQAAAARAAAQSAQLRVAALTQQLTAARTKALDAVASVDQMRAQAASAAAQAQRARNVAQTEATLAGFTSVTSPSDAVVIKRLIDPGVYVQSGTPIARIAVLDRLRIQANVAQRDLAAIAAGTPVEATLPDGTVVRGRVSSVSPVADAATHTAAVEAIVSNARGMLVSGGYVRVTFHAQGARVAGGFSVPSAAIVGADRDAAVWRISADKTAHRVPVRVLNDNGVSATVTGDLAHDARVVVEGAPTLEEGQAVTEERS